VSGSNDVNVQAIVNAINNAIGAYGKTIDWSTPVNYRQGIDKEMHDLVDQMAAGQTGALFIHNANPAYNYYDADKFKVALKKVKLAVSFTGKMDETTELCNFIIPDHHYLKVGATQNLKQDIQVFFSQLFIHYLKHVHSRHHY